MSPEPRFVQRPADDVVSRPEGELESILRDVADAVRRAGEVPEAIREAGRVAFTRRNLDPGAVVVSVGYDSLLDDSVEMRAPGSPRIVTFETDSLSIEVSISHEQLVGQLIPPAAGTVTMLTIDGIVDEGTVDEMGRFALRPPAAGPTRLRCRVGESEVVTDWMDLRPVPPPDPA